MVDPFPKKNTFVDNYPIIKWDLIFNIIILAGWLWAINWKPLAVLIFLQVFIASWYIFNYRKKTIPIIIITLSLIPFASYILVKDSLIRDWTLFGGFAILTYGIFWFFVANKNMKLYLKSLEPEVCNVCGLKKQSFIIHLGERMCADCFHTQAFMEMDYHGSWVYKWDYDILNFFENQLEEPVPKLTSEYTQEQNAPELMMKLYGYVEEDKNIVELYLSEKHIKEIPPFIGLLLHLKILYLRHNEISKLPGSLQDLASLNILNLVGNNIKYIDPEAEKALHILKKRHCKIYFK